LGQGQAETLLLPTPPRGQSEHSGHRQRRFLAKNPEGMVMVVRVQCRHRRGRTVQGRVTNTWTTPGIVALMQSSQASA